MAAMVSTAVQSRNGRSVQAEVILGREAATRVLGAVASRLEQDGDVDIVQERAAQRLRDACDGMGAVLRFRLHA